MKQRGKTFYSSINDDALFNLMTMNAREYPYYNSAVKIDKICKTDI